MKFDTETKSISIEPVISFEDVTFSYDTNGHLRTWPDGKPMTEEDYQNLLKESEYQWQRKAMQNSVIQSYLANLPCASQYEFADVIKKVGKMEKKAKHIHRRDVGVREEPKINRNATCPCGSGLKFKKCCREKD